ncbi:MAG: transporter substrate-binding domain-containing protein [Prevotella sp.]|nr:transporter substrate-binding domain-containing protein [Prevotella sp.]
MNKKRHRLLICMLVVMLVWSGIAAAQQPPQQETLHADTLGLAEAVSPPPAHSRAYTKEEPLIYEGSWDLWPYTFLNIKGEPDGYSVDLVRLIMKHLRIPYEIHLKPTATAFNDLREGRADLMLGVAAGFHDAYGSYGKTALTLFTQSVATPKSKPVEISRFRDLADHKVIVNQTSLCYHLMIDYGWADNAIPSTDLKESILEVSNKEEGQIVWNTLSLKWLIKRYQLDNLEVTPVNMPHGEYKFMSNDLQLLEKLDSVYAELNSAELIAPIQNKWFYPDRREKQTPQWVWYVLATFSLFALILLVYIISYRIQARRITNENNKRNRRLALILETSQVHIWTYDVVAREFTWRNENGQPAYTYTPEEFSRRYAPEDYKRLRNAIFRLSDQPKPENGKKEEEVRLNIKAKDTEEGSDEIRDYVIMLSVLSRDAQGRPTVIIGTKKDVTEAIVEERLTDERALRYWAIFNTPLVGIILFDKHGLMQNINQKACEIYDCDHDTILAEHVSIYDMLDIDGVDIDELDGMHASQYVNIDKIPASERIVPQVHRQGVFCNEFDLITVYDDESKPIGIFAICRDVTMIRENQHVKALEEEDVARLEKELAECNSTIDDVLRESDVRLVSYSPDSHILTIFSRTNEVQYALTQTRCMSLVSDHSKKLTMRLLDKMDRREDNDIKGDIITSLRIKGGMMLQLQFSLSPTHDQQGRIASYLGICYDLSELRHIEQAIARAELSNPAKTL